MTTFDDRETAFENLYVHDQDLAFRAEARRNGEVAHWAASLLGKAAAESDAYAGHIHALAMAEGTEAVVGAFVDDLKPLQVSERQIRNHMELAMAKAMMQVKAE